MLFEPEREQFVRAIGAARQPCISAGTLVEATIGAESRRGETAGRELDLFLYRAGIKVVAVSEQQALLAREAWRRYGKAGILQFQIVATCCPMPSLAPTVTRRS